jgi:hypothetical protein
MHESHVIAEGEDIINFKGLKILLIEEVGCQSLGDFAGQGHSGLLCDQ